MIMWIILGSLIAVVAIFLIFTGLMDRKKTKKIRAKNRELELLRQDAGDLIAIWVNIVIESNNQLLKQFVPSVGHFKMKHLCASAKKSLILLTKQQPYELIKDSKGEKERNICQKFDELLNDNSNNWSKNHAQTVEFFRKIAEQANQVEKNHVFFQEATKNIKGVYNEFTK